MKTRLCSLCSSLAFGFFLMLGTGMVCSSCQDDLLEDSYPSWLGSSIYGELQSRGNFNYTLRLIDDLNYGEVLRKTGSKTVFVANDDAWNRFFKDNSNPWGVASYEGLSLDQKKWILNNAMINAAYLGERLSTTTGDNAGMAMRRPNSTNVMDSVIIYAGAKKDELPLTSYWNRLRQQDTVRLGYPIGDNAPMVHFVQDFRVNKQVTDADMTFMFGAAFDPKYEIYLFNDPVVEQDVTCQNGYIHVLRDLLVPPSNMAVEVANVSEASKFSSFLERYTMPVATTWRSEGQTVYRKGYFAQNGDYALKTDSNGATQPQLLYDPAWQRDRFATGVTFQEDMAVMFVPTNAALDEWWNSSTGKLVMNGYENWEQVPNDLLSRLINNHMKTSFLGSLPSIFNKVLNDGNREQGIKEADVVGKYLANNGMIYLVNKVYTPDSYISVMAPCLNIDNLKVMGWAVVNTDKTTYIPDGYGTYLNSMESSFSFVVPGDDALKEYVDPFYISEDGSYRRITFTYNEQKLRVEAVSTIVDRDGNSNGKLDAVNTEKTATLLKDILDNCIMVMDKADWSKGGYYKTKVGAFLDVSGFKAGEVIRSGGNIERSERPVVSRFFNQSQQTLNGEPGSGGNGVTMAVDVAIQPTLSSTINVLNNYQEFREFAALLSGKDDVLATEYAALQDSLKLYQALILPKTGSGATAPQTSRGERVGFLGNYNYTCYVPMNEAMAQAYSQGLPRWSDADALPKPKEDGEWESEEIKKQSIEQRKIIARKILNFLRFHFQDNSIYTDGLAGTYKTQSFNEMESVFYQLRAEPSTNSFEVASVSASDSRASVDRSLCNMMAREYQFNGAIATATKINSSSYLVIHAINAPLFFSKKGADGRREQFK